MVLATRLILLAALASTGCHANYPSAHDKEIIQGHHLQLINNDSTCLLIANKNKTAHSYTLLIKPPCYFAKKNNGNILQFPYPDKKLDAVSLVIGDPISAEKQKKWNLDESAICGEKRQAVFFYKGNITVSNFTSDGGLACKDTGIDEKEFHFFSEKFKPQE